jgi:putative ABC transport system permease protein
MLKNYLLTSWRNVRRNGVFSVINITGLAVGLSVSFLLYQYILIERSYDQFHVNSGDIYRATMLYKSGENNDKVSSVTHPALGPALKAEFPEIKDFTRVVRTSLFASITLSYEAPEGARTFNERRAFFADETFFNIFSFPFLEGTPATALKEPWSLVITESTAKKYFDDGQALGKEIRLIGATPLKVTGVLKDLPENSHLQFDVLLSFNLMGEKWNYGNWGWPEFFNYVRLQPGADPSALEAKIPPFVKKHMGASLRNFKEDARVHLQPLTQIYLSSDPRYPSGNANARTVYFLSILAIFILVIAWINYVNMATANSLQRAKEVGLRKVVGANKRQLIAQFMLDAFLVNLLAVLAAGLLVSLSLDAMQSITGKNIEAFIYSQGLWSSPLSWISFAAVFFLGVILVGSYPAIVLASYKPTTVLKGKFSRSPSGNIVRKSLVSFQYVLSIVLIAGTLLIYQQLSFMNSKDPGYAKDEILVLRAPNVYDSMRNSNIELLKNDLKRLSFIKDVTRSFDIPGQVINDRNDVRQAGASMDKSFTTYIVGIDAEFFKTYNVPTVAGRAFLPDDQMSPLFRPVKGPLKPVRVVLNEEAARRLGYLHPEDAVQQEIIFSYVTGEHRATVIGVVKNYHQISLKEGYKPILYFYPGDDAWAYISLRIDGRDTSDRLVSVQQSYARIFPDAAFEYFFLDDHFNSQHKAERQFGTLFGTFTVIAILVACLGLLGLSIFNVNQRVREIGIRKVLGATFANILLLFSKDFVRILLWSYVLAIPVIYSGATSWLDTFAFHIPIGWAIFVIPPILLLLISLITVFAVGLKTALMNPAVSLRQD